MSRIFNPKKETIRPNEIPTPYSQKDGYKKDGTPRKLKWKIKAQQGCVSANEYVWWYYYGEHEKDMIPVFLDGNALNTSKDNIMLVSKRELKNMVHFHNNMFVENNRELRQLGIYITRASLKLKDLEKEVNENEGN